MRNQSPASQDRNALELSIPGRPRSFALSLLVILGLSGNTLAGTVTYVYTDNAGSVLATTDAQGNTVQPSDYKPYGALTAQAPVTATAFTGHVLDADTGLTYMQNRYFDSSIGRFISVDPAPVTDGSLFAINRYAYANDNPYAYTDPDGAESCGVWACETYDSGYDDGSSGSGDEGSQAGGRYVVGFDGAGENIVGREGTENDVFDKYVESMPGGKQVDGGLMFTGIRGRAQAAAAIDWKQRNPSGHVNIFGYSRGGAAAVAMANQMGAKKAAVNLLVLFDPVAALTSTLTLQFNNVNTGLDFYQQNPVTRFDLANNPFNGGPAVGPNMTNVNLTGRRISDGLITHNNIVSYIIGEPGYRGMLNAAQ